MSSDGREWLIRKSGLFYSPNRAGYTIAAMFAGLYTEEEAKAEARVEDTISAYHASEFADEIRVGREYIARFHFID